jgi:hypothetical protein
MDEAGGPKAAPADKYDLQAMSSRGSPPRRVRINNIAVNLMSLVGSTAAIVTAAFAISVPPVRAEPFAHANARSGLPAANPDRAGFAADDRDIRPLTRPVVVLYGDSLAWEAQDFFVDAFADHPDTEIVVRTFGGTAICDWLDAMANDAVTLAPGVVVVEFSGNAMTPCMLDADGRPLSGADYFEHYAADAEAVIDTFVPIGTQVVFAGAPISRTDQHAGRFREARLNPLYERLGQINPRVRYVNAGAAVLESGRWTATLPCQPTEPCTGGVDAVGRDANVVRAPDGNHFCPASDGAVRGVTGSCPVWSSGAFRYGTALARPVIASLDATREGDPRSAE